MERTASRRYPGASDGAIGDLLLQQPLPGARYWA